MNKVEIKKLFWELVHGIEYCSDTVVENEAGVVVERGMMLSNDYSIMFGLDDGVIRIYNKEHSPLIAFTEESEVLLIMKELLESLGITKEAPEVLAQEQSKKFITDYGSGNFKFIKLFNNKKLYDEVLKANKNNIGLILTPEVLKMSQINSIEQIFMVGVLKDR